MSDLNALLERVRAATGPDRELDGMIAAIVAGRDLVAGVYQPTGTCCWLARNRKAPHDAYVTWAGGSDAPDFGTARYTSSVDAALALVERMLPGWKRSFFEKRGGGWISRVSSPRWDTHTSGEDTPLPLPALAILAACLTALSTTEDAQGGE